MRRIVGMFLSLLFCVGLSAGAQTATHTVLYSFQGPTTDGESPYGPLVQAPDGNFYGMTPGGGANGFGVIYRLSPTGTESLVYSFPGGTGGSGSLNGLTVGTDGKLYGLTSGGTYSSGQFFSVTTSGTFSTLYNFTSGSDGSGPQGAPAQAEDGNFYGVASNGGLGYGTIYKLSPTGSFTQLYQFTGVQDSGAPYAGLIEGTDGSFYGTNNSSDTGAVETVGSVFKITKDGVFTTLHNFAGADGSNPDGGLMEGADGAFYGTTHNGGLGQSDDDSGFGTIFKITSDGTFTTLYKFTGSTDGGHPEGSLALGSDGNFYGTSTGTGNGNFYQVTPTGTLTVLHSFTAYADGSEPLSGPIQGADGNLYGTTESGGDDRFGTIYEIIPVVALPVAVQLAASTATPALGTPFTLNWKVLNASTASQRQCVASVQGGAINAGNWAGIQAGTVSGVTYSGSASVTPVGSGSFTYVLTCGGSESGFATVTVAPLVITTTALPNATTGAAYQQTLAASSGLSPYTWSVISGSLPAGLTLSSSTGAITGTPTQPGTFAFSVEVIDAETPAAAATANLSLTVVSPAPNLTASSSSLSVAAGSTVVTTLTASGFSSSSLTFSCSGLPAESACAFSAPSGNSAASTVALQISTSAGLATSQIFMGQRFGIEFALVFPGTLLLACFNRKTRRKLLGAGGVLLIVFSLATVALVGCGGGGTPSSPTTSTTRGTPKGTSTVTVTASAGSQTATTTVTLIVQ